DRSAVNLIILAAILLLVVGGVAYGAMRLLRGDGAGSAATSTQAAALPAADLTNVADALAEPDPMAAADLSATSSAASAGAPVAPPTPPVNQGAAAPAASASATQTSAAAAAAPPPVQRPAA